MTVTEPRPPSTAPSGADTRAEAVPDVVVGPMRRRHLRPVLRIEGRTSTTPWSLGLFVAELGRDQRVYLVARRGTQVVGYAGALLVAGEAHITTIAVDPDHQGGAIGRRLLLALIRESVRLGTLAVTLEVRASNEPARALYRRFGFVPAGVRKGYYSKPTEDALVLWAHDVAEAPYRERLAAIEEALPSPFVLAGPDAVDPFDPDPSDPDLVTDDPLGPEHPTDLHPKDSP